MKTIDDLYAEACLAPSDINELLPILRNIASGCYNVTEFGMRGGLSTRALIAGRPQRVSSYDLSLQRETVQTLKQAAMDALVMLDVYQEDTLQCKIFPTDFLFIDTLHTDAQLRGELEKHNQQVQHWIAIHDTITFGAVGEDGGPGLMSAVVHFLEFHKEWVISEHYGFNNGLLVLQHV